MVQDHVDPVGDPADPGQLVVVDMLLPESASGNHDRNRPGSDGFLDGCRSRMADDDPGLGHPPGEHVGRDGARAAFAETLKRIGVAA